MLSCWESKFFHNDDSISKDEIHIIRSDFGESGSYGLSFWSICLGHNTYAGPIRGKRYNATPIKGPVLNKYDKKTHYKTYSFNVITQVSDEKIIKNLTINASYAPPQNYFSI